VVTRRKKLLGVVASQDAVEVKLLSWVRGVVQSNDQLLDALKRLHRSYLVLSAGKSVPDAEEILWQVGIAVSDAERSRNALALKSSGGPERA
jgi:hypothetical protein